MQHETIILAIHVGIYQIRRFYHIFSAKSVPEKNPEIFEHVWSAVYGKFDAVIPEPHTMQQGIIFFAIHVIISQIGCFYNVF